MLQLCDYLPSGRPWCYGGRGRKWHLPDWSTPFEGALMTPMDAFIARANIVRMRLQLATSLDAATQTTLQELLEHQLEALRAGEAEETSEPG